MRIAARIIHVLAIGLLLAGCARAATVEQSCLEHAAAKNLPASNERAYYERCLKDLTPTREELDKRDAWQEADRHCKTIAKAEFARAWSQSKRQGVEQGFAAGAAKKAAYEECMLRLKRSAVQSFGGSTVNADDDGGATCLAVYDRVVADRRQRGLDAISEMKKGIAKAGLDEQKTQDLTIQAVRALESSNALLQEYNKLILQQCLEGKISAAEWYSQERRSLQQ